MAMFLNLAKLTPDATKGLVGEGIGARADYFRQVTGAAGWKTHGYYLVEGGEWDIAVILEVPDGDAGAALAMSFLGSQANGLWDRSRSYRLYSPEEADATRTGVATLVLPGEE